jgi:hypothetical protein
MYKPISNGSYHLPTVAKGQASDSGPETHGVLEK